MSITIHTRQGKEVANFQSKTLSPFQQNQMAPTRIKYQKSMIAIRCHSSGFYNCHGMTFAGRRTEIYDSGEVKRIIVEDDYDEIRLDQILPGDVMLYFADDGDVEHSAIIVEKPSVPFNIPMVCSKWGCHWEVIHWANDCPYNMSQARYYRISK